MNNDFFTINHTRLARLISVSGLNATTHWDQVNQEEPKLHFIAQGKNLIHAIPSYNTDHVDIDQYLDFFSRDKVHTAMLPTTLAINDKLVDIATLERPKLLNLKLHNNTEKQWRLLHKSKQRSISKMKGDIEFGLSDDTGDIREKFIDSFLKVQLSRSTSISHFFDSESLNDILALNDSTLFYAFSKNDPSSMLFHLNFFVGDTCYFLFSSNISEQARSFSAALHWLVIEWLNTKNAYKYYSLGGGVRKGDGIEKFKSQLGATLIDRHYAIYPREKYNPESFFPVSHSFLSNQYCA